MSQKDITLQGTLESIIFSNPETGFMIARFALESQVHPITIKGTVFNVALHDILRIKGYWEEDKNYGQQFKLKEFMPIQPSSTSGIKRYLASDRFKGIGKKTAQAIVDYFGEKTFEILDKEPEKLLKVPKFTQKQLDRILAGLQELKKSKQKLEHAQEESREATTFLYGLGISEKQSEKIFELYGLSCIPILQNNPYQLSQISGIGFRKADTIARNLGFDEDSPFRAVAGVLYVLEQQAMKGHTCFPKELLIQTASEELKIKENLAQEAVESLLKDRLIKSKTLSNTENGSEQRLSLLRYYYAERRVAENLFRILESEAYTQFEAVTQKIKDEEKHLGIQLDPVQLKAVHAALQHKVLILTGGPGTGKTTIVRFILSLIRHYIPEVALAAPTGRAAKCLAEATGIKASTIHRLLEANNLGFQKDKDNPLKQELFIIDESSMIDTLLMDALLEALPSTARLVLVGDVDQLPSVGAGMILHDLIASNLVPVIRLETIFRQAKNSKITLNAHQICKGELPDFQSVSESELCDFYFIKTKAPERIVQRIISMVTENLPQKFGFDSLQEIQVLTPMHRGITGSINLNHALQTALNPKSPHKKEFAYHELIFREGDKVMQQQNSYDKKLAEEIKGRVDVFNGDVGIIKDCNTHTRELIVEFDQGAVHYSTKELQELSLSYAISVHKSQGSEYPAVILPFTTHHYMMLQRNLLYTAITRGKQMFVLIGTSEAVEKAVHNDSTLTRYTTLYDELMELSG